MSSSSSKAKTVPKAKNRSSTNVRRRSPASSRPNSRQGNRAVGNRGGNGSRAGTPKPKGNSSGRSTPSNSRPGGSASKPTVAMHRRDDPIPELENHFILRLPQQTANDLRKILNTGSQILKDKLAIEVMSDMRHGTVKFNNEVFAAKLMDLPCILESHKTIDKKTFWKTADICQMLVCTTEDETLETEQKEKELEEKGLKKLERVDKKFICNHGVTPSLKNVRKRRFRKTAKKKYIEAPDVEEEVKRLLRMDSTAIKIRWEVLAEEDLKDDNRADNPGVSHGSAEGDDLTRIFGDVSSSEDEDEDINILDMDEDTRDSGLMGEGEEAGEMEEEEEEGEEEDSKMGIEEAEQPNEFVNRLEELRKELAKLEERQRALEESISSMDNMQLKDRFQSQLDSVLEDIKIRQKEVETLEALIGVV